MDYSVVDFKIRGDDRGSLVALESFGNVPFEVKRVYYIYGTAYDAIRGKHAHKKLEQMIICVSGSCDFLLDDGRNKNIVHLDNPAKGLYLKNTIWREFTNFSKDCVLVVLASEHYDESDYFRNYDDFLKFVGVK